MGVGQFHNNFNGTACEKCIVYTYFLDELDRATVLYNFF